MSDSFDEQFDNMTASLGNLSNASDDILTYKEEKSNLKNESIIFETADEDLNTDESHLIDQIYYSLENDDFVKAESLIIEAQKKDIRNDKLYLSIIMLDMRVSNLEMLGECLEFYQYSQNSNNYKRAFKFCDKELQNTLNSYVNNSYCKNLYRTAKSLMTESQKEFNTLQLEEAIKLFREIDGYKDSTTLYEQSSALLTDWENKEVTYEKVLSSKDKWKNLTLTNLLNIKKETTELKHYKDSDQLLNELAPILKLKQKQEDDYLYDRKTKKYFCGFLVITFIIGLCLIITGAEWVKDSPIIPIFTFLSFFGIIITLFDLIKSWMWHSITSK